jgi:hypothetical protein
MAFPRTKFVWTAALLICAVVPASAQGTGSRPVVDALTCDAGSLNADSYGLTTRAQAHIINQDRGSWWQGFDVASARADLGNLNASATYAAERALELDPRNLLAHGLLARQYVVLGEDAALADRSWQAVLNAGGAVVWTSTLYDVDARSYFLMAFDRAALRVYRYGELAGPYETHLGLPMFVGEERERFWRAMAGCIDSQARPEAVVPWSAVREIKTGNWVLYFKLTRPVTIASDRGKKKTVSELKVNLHGAMGTVEVHATRDSRDPWNVSLRTMGIGPLAYQQRIRFTLVKFVDPTGRIGLPKASRSAGW